MRRNAVARGKMDLTTMSSAGGAAVTTTAAQCSDDRPRSGARQRPRTNSCRKTTPGRPRTCRATPRTSLRSRRATRATETRVTCQNTTVGTTGRPLPKVTTVHPRARAYLGMLMDLRRRLNKDEIPRRIFTAGRRRSQVRRGASSLMISSRSWARSRTTRRLRLRARINSGGRQHNGRLGRRKGPSPFRTCRIPRFQSALRAESATLLREEAKEKR